MKGISISLERWRRNKDVSLKPKTATAALGRLIAGFGGAFFVLWLVWTFVLTPLKFPEMSLVGSYFWESVWSPDNYKSAMMTGFRALVATFVGFGFAAVLAILTGRSWIGWVLFFFLLFILQKIPAVAMVHVLVESSLGIGFGMTVVLSSMVVMTFTWLILHHRAKTLDPRELFALRVVGFRGVRLWLYGLLPHLGSAIGGAARLAMSIAIIMTVIGEWQGLWSDGSIWQYGLGSQISRQYDAENSTARVLASCIWLGLLGLVMDGIVQLVLRLSRTLTGVDFKR